MSQHRANANAGQHRCVRILSSVMRGADANVYLSAELMIRTINQFRRGTTGRRRERPSDEGFVMVTPC
ncbi:hypothetical protein FOA52_006106 [Chlamydomonas sp. UWO 241]|nr:hypothetical protein FOA52_006106 [Chlamydomonas sp. UWO 241]